MTLPPSLIELQHTSKTMAEKFLKETGGMPPLVHIYLADGRVIAFDCKGQSEDEEAYRKQKLITFIHTMRINGFFYGATMTSEAWKSVVFTTDGKMPKEYTRPADDPKREENLVASAWDRDGNRSHHMAVIIRTNGKAEVGPWEKFGGETKAWIDSAFVDAEKIMGATT